MKIKNIKNLIKTKDKSIPQLLSYLFQINSQAETPQNYFLRKEGFWKPTLYIYNNCVIFNKKKNIKRDRIDFIWRHNEYLINKKWRRLCT